MHSALISSLYKRRSTKGLFPQEPEQTNAASGNEKSSSENTISTHSSIKYGTRSRFSNFLPAGLEAAYLLTTGSQYARVLLKRTSGRLGRRSPKWVSKTPVSTSTGALTTGSNDRSKGGKNQMGPRSGSNPSTSDWYIAPLPHSTDRITKRATASSGSSTWPCFS